MRNVSSRLFTFLDVALYSWLVIACIAIPFIVDPSLVNPYILPKQMLVTTVAVVGAVLWGARAVLAKKVVVFTSVLDKLFIAFLGAALASALFSDSQLVSFIGLSEFFAPNIIFFGALFLIYLLYNHTLVSLPRWQGVVDTIIGMGALIAICVSANLIWQADVFAGLTGGRLNTIDTGSSMVGLWLATSFVLAIGTMLKRDIPLVRQILYGVAIITCALTLIMLNYLALWWLLLASFVLLLGISILYIKEVRLPLVSFIFSVLIGVVVMLGLGVPKIVNTSLPSEVVLSHPSSWVIAQGSVTASVKNSLLGNGFGTFLLAFSHFRDSSFNADPQAWSIRFNQPFSSFVGMIVEGGVLVGSTLIVIVLFAIGLITHAAKQAQRYAARGAIVRFFADGSTDSPPLFEVLVLAVAWLLVTAGMFLFFYGPVMWWVWFVLTSLLLVGLSFTRNGLFAVYEYRLADKPEYTLSLSFVGIMIMALVIVGGVWGARWYRAEEAYSAALIATDLNEVENYLQKAAQTHVVDDRYYVALARVYLYKAITLSNVSSPDIEAVGSMVERAVNTARKASDYAPNSASVWENLAAMYEGAAELIPEARSWAITSYDRARKLEPTNPVLVAKLAENYAASGSYSEALAHYKQSIALKPDFAPAYNGLGYVHEQLKDIDEAIAAYRILASLQPTRVEPAYNYARLLYNRNEDSDRLEAEKVWLAIIAAEPNHTNSLFSLGLLFETRGNSVRALEYYKKILVLLPDNEEVKKKVAKLQ